LDAEVQQLKVELQKSKHPPAEPPLESLARQENAEPQAEWIHTARLLTLGKLAASLAHELNQPLSAIATYAHAGKQLLESGKFAEQEVIELLERVAGQAERAGELIRRLRRFAIRGDTQRQAAHVNGIVREALALIEFELRNHSVQTRLQLAENIPTILVDPVQIGQVLLNLFSNAIEAMHDTPLDQRLLSITTQCAGTDIEISVSDTGSGLSLEIVRNLFEAFRTTKPNGMGLGLSICRTIVQAHNGRLWVKPNPRRGTTFFIALPLSIP
jgi:C4-dicarboxylate-specific signal transduction histidine kinase